MLGYGRRWVSNIIQNIMHYYQEKMYSSIQQYIGILYLSMLMTEVETLFNILWVVMFKQFNKSMLYLHGGRQLSSSLPSPQSRMLLHRLARGIHCPDLHVNSVSRQETVNRITFLLVFMIHLWNQYLKKKLVKINIKLHGNLGTVVAQNSYWITLRFTYIVLVLVCMCLLASFLFRACMGLVILWPWITPETFGSSHYTLGSWSQWATTQYWRPPPHFTSILFLLHTVLIKWWITIHRCFSNSKITFLLLSKHFEFT